MRLLYAMALVSACAPAVPLPEGVRWSSPHFVYHAELADEDTCAGIMMTLEQHFAQTQRTLGFSWPEGRTLDYYKFRSHAALAGSEQCPPGADACFLQDRVMTSSAFDRHELVHAYLAPTGLPTPLIMEGIAEVLSCDGSVPAAPAPPIGFDDPSLYGRYLPEDAAIYRWGQQFVAYLVQTYPSPQFLELYQKSQLVDSPADFARAFASVYGTSLDLAWQASGAAEGPGRACLFDWECSGVPVSLDGTAASLDRVCDQRDRFRTLELESAATVELRASPEFAYVRSCNGSQAAPGEQDPAGLPILYATAFALGPGRYFLKSDVATDVQGVMHAPSFFGANCLDLVPREVGDANERINLIQRPAGSDWYARFYARHPVQVRAWLDATPAIAGEVCGQCNADCQVLSDAIVLEAGRAFMLHFAEGDPDTPDARATVEVTLDSVAASASPITAQTASARRP